jgi:hypothetical protein
MVEGGWSMGNNILERNQPLLLKFVGRICRDVQ